MLGWQEDDITELSQTCAPTTYRMLVLDIKAGTYKIIRRTAQALHFSRPGLNGCENIYDYTVLTDNGIEYSANLDNERSTVNPHLKPIETEKIMMDDDIRVTYRAYIEALQREVRNIIRVESPGRTIQQLDLNMKNVPYGIEVFTPYPGDKYYEKQAWYGTDTATHVVLIEVYEDGQFSFDIGIEINGKNCGTVTCIINKS
jgi:hypothetical protein